MNSKKTRICIILLALLASYADNKEQSCPTLDASTTLIKRYQQGKKMLLPYLSEACEDGVLAAVEANELENLLEQFDEKDVIKPSRPIDPDGYVILKYRMK